MVVLRHWTAKRTIGLRFETVFVLPTKPDPPNPLKKGEPELSLFNLFKRTLGKTQDDFKVPLFKRDLGGSGLCNHTLFLDHSLKTKP
jgi:hypothetical protein